MGEYFECGWLWLELLEPDVYSALSLSLQVIRLSNLSNNIYFYSRFNFYLHICVKQCCQVFQSKKRQSSFQKLPKSTTGILTHFYLILNVMSFFFLLVDLFCSGVNLEVKNPRNRLKIKSTFKEAKLPKNTKNTQNRRQRAGARERGWKLPKNCLSASSLFLRECNAQNRLIDSFSHNLATLVLNLFPPPFLGDWRYL